MYMYTVLKFLLQWNGEAKLYIYDWKKILTVSMKQKTGFIYLVKI